MTTKTQKLNSVLLNDKNEIENFLHRKILENYSAVKIFTFDSEVKALEYLAQATDIPQLIFIDINFSLMNRVEFLDKFKKLKIAQHSIDIFILPASFNTSDIKKTQQKRTDFVQEPVAKEKVLAPAITKLSTLIGIGQREDKEFKELIDWITRH